MGFLSTEKKQLLFDYCMGIASEQEVAEAEQLMASVSEADQFVTGLKATLEPLDTLESEPCPDDLARRTINRLKSASRSQALNFALPTQDQPQIIKVRSWRQFVQMAAIAAILLFVVSVSIPSLKMMREKQQQDHCLVHLDSVSKGMAAYMNDYDRPPTVAISSGAPWWKVGYQGQENYSNTRGIWLLPKQGYVAFDQLLCPSRQKSSSPDLKALNSDQLNDFPSREYIDYSFRVCCGMKLSGRTPMMADRNPLYEDLPSDYSKPLRIQLNEKLLNANSGNHHERGQAILFSDGSVLFSRSRTVNATNDDIYSLSSMVSGSNVNGCEKPSCLTDAFLAP
jgi:hypothetical protein